MSGFVSLVAEGVTDVSRFEWPHGESHGWRPDALGVFLDADNKTPQEQLSGYQDALQDTLQPSEVFPALNALTAPAQVSRDGNDGRAVGIFVFPNKDESGTLDALLLGLGAAAFPELHRRCQGYVDDWKQKHGDRPESNELGKPAGPAKAHLSMMAAILKPGRNINASLQDHAWVPSGAVPTLLEPLVTFLGALGVPHSEVMHG